MKDLKKLLFILLSALSLTAFAQSDVKRVAILEIVDKMGTVPYIKQLAFRSNLTTAISNTFGYEGYDRVDIQQILGEQNFQRTGWVRDADIKKIGEFTGAKYVIVAEAVIDGVEMLITAKIIDVETARVMRNSDQLMGTSTAEMKAGSAKVAADLLTPTPEEKAKIAAVQAEEAKRKHYEDLQTQGYVDLGLPSGTWWKKENEDGCFKFSSACRQYHSKLPTKEQFKELLESCNVELTGKGLICTSKYNGKSILFPSGHLQGGCNGKKSYDEDMGLYCSSTNYNNDGDEWIWLLEWFYTIGIKNNYHLTSGPSCYYGAIRFVAK